MSDFKEQAGFTLASYDEVPWHRKLWAVNVFTLVFPILVLGVLLTGNAYYQKGGKVATISGGRRWVHIVITAWFTSASVYSIMKQ